MALRSLTVGEITLYYSSSNSQERLSSPFPAKEAGLRLFMYHSFTTFRERWKTGQDGGEGSVRLAYNNCGDTIIIQYHHHYPLLLLSERQGKEINYIVGQRRVWKKLRSSSSMIRFRQEQLLPKQGLFRLAKKRGTIGDKSRATFEIPSRRLNITIYPILLHMVF